MKRENANLIYSPSDLIDFMESQFVSWMNRSELEIPGRYPKDEGDESLKLLWNMGLEHEKAYLQLLKDGNADVCEIADSKSGYADTLKAMEAGRGIIYQAVLKHGQFAGIADFLCRVDGQPVYEVWDTKLALKPKPYFIIQLCCYAEMLEAIQGTRPETIAIVLGNRKKQSFRTDDYFYYYRQIKKAFLEQQEAFDPNKMPEPLGADKIGHWQSFAKDFLVAHDHLSQVARISKTQIVKLENFGITTMNALATSELSRVPKMSPETFASLKEQAKLQVESAALEKPKYELIPADAKNPRKGLALLPPPSLLDIFFDMEGYPYAEGGLEYLFGATYIALGEPAFQDFWAHDRIQEQKAFEAFVDFAYARWKNDPSMHVYHYASYEKSALRRLAGRYGSREAEVDDLLRNEVLVDLYTIVSQALRIGEPSYSIKYVERLYKEKRKTAVATAMDSVIAYQRWLENNDGNTWQESARLKAIREYNKEDCDSTLALAEWLRDLQSKNAIQFIPKPPADENEKSVHGRDARAELAKHLLASLPDAIKQKDNYRLQMLLAHLLEFHWREARPVFWSRYDRAEKTEEELAEDIDCLAGLKRTNTPRQQVKQSYEFEYQYDPDQDTKLQAGGRCFFAHDLTQAINISELNSDSGRVVLKRDIKFSDPPEKLSLIPDDYVKADSIADSIFRTVTEWQQSGKLPQALEDFLLHRRPKLKGNSQGPIIANASDITEGANAAVEMLESSTLCIQGPPGSGKTYTAAKMILSLLKNGKTVGVSSHGHKAIAHLMDKVAKLAKTENFSLRAAKIQRNEKDVHLKSASIAKEKTASDLFANGSYTFIGGTAWAFSDPAAAGKLDYLFVDEAGQVSVANLAGMAPSTENIVLVGDQMQLSQPLKGSHPGESGKSTLEYLLEGHQTIPSDFGIFLDTTKRMHPKVCELISGAVYENRLHSAPETEKRTLVLSKSKLITKDAGILFIPVAHEGNTYGSDEEAEKIGELINELLDQNIIDLAGNVRPIAKSDIKIVAPYNMQVRKLKELIPAVDVGTVDKFQGLDAPIVIVSMCASDGSVSPRGIEFLFSKNRLNVAISRAESLAIVVGSPALARTACSSVEQMSLVNFFCRIVETGTERQKALLNT